MKGYKKAALALFLAFSVTASGCYGKFALTKKVYDLNGKITDSKFVHSLVMIGFYIVPIYGLALLGDALIFNVIEFWSGDNPVVEKTGDNRVAIRKDGKTYEIESLGHQSFAMYIDGKLAALASRDGAGKLSVRDLSGKRLGTMSAVTMEQFAAWQAAQSCSYCYF